MTLDLGLDRPIPRKRRVQFLRLPDVEAYRVVEILLVVAAVIFLLPLLLVIGAAVKATSRGPVLYRQQRLGRGGQLFGCLKFRSMQADADDRLAALLESDPVARREWDVYRKLTYDPRVTPFGHFLRRSSLDELPQLLNVLSGEMSLVGPRPIVVGEIQHYGRHIRAYCSVRPGISGLWQISGRSDTTYRRRVAFDRVYVKNKSFALDMAITLRTIPAVLSSRGAR